MIYFFVHIRISYYWFNRMESLLKPKGRYHDVGGNEKAGEYYLKNRRAGGLKENANNNYKSLIVRRRKRSKNRISKK